MIIEAISAWFATSLPSLLTSGGTTAATHVGDFVEGVGAAVPLGVLFVVGILARFLVARAASKQQWSWTSIGTWAFILLVFFQTVGSPYYVLWEKARHLVSDSRDDLGALRPGYEPKTDPLRPALTETKVRVKIWPCFLAANALITTWTEGVGKFFDSWWVKMWLVFVVIYVLLQIGKGIKASFDSRSRARYHDKSVHTYDSYLAAQQTKT